MYLAIGTYLDATAPTFVSADIWRNRVDFIYVESCLLQGSSLQAYPPAASLPQHMPQHKFTGLITASGETWKVGRQNSPLGKTGDDVAGDAVEKRRHARDKGV
ncbi:MAG: hypothetical protein M1813_000705 [Trichoglossum hirsutum]|nr:MAG: hypothetical protein M1813_000705 [Trichoglossum hirsutum]